MLSKKPDKRLDKNPCFLRGKTPNKLLPELILLEIIFFVSLIPLPNASGMLGQRKDIIFSLNQTDYYFKVGENAVIPLEIENTYGKTINGMLIYSYTQEINQGGVHFSSSNTNSISFSVGNGKSIKNLNFGTSKTPSVFNVDLKFVYTEKEKREVSLNNIKIHFVSDYSQKQNTQNRQSASSKESLDQNQQSAQSQNSQSFYSQMQKQFNQMFSQNRQSQRQNPQQKLENNQLNQDSSSLKKQMQKQFQEQQQLKKEFQKHLIQNKEFQRYHQDLLNQGYNLSSMSVNPSSKNSGDFDFKYKKPNGETAELKGTMNNNTITNLQKLDSKEKKKILQNLEKNKDFQKLNKQLEKQGFNKTSMQFSLEDNKTKAGIIYKNSENKTAEISAEVVNGTVQNVKLEKNTGSNKSSTKTKILIWLVILATCLILGYYMYKKYYKKRKSTEMPEKPNSKPKETPFNYKKEAKNLLEDAKKLFSQGLHKDAYEKAGQSLRVYLSYKHGLKKQVTNEKIIKFLRKKRKDIKEIKKCFDLCSLVEFAKYKANKKDFYEIIKIIEDIEGISGH